MNYIDLNALLRVYGTKGIERCVVYGRLVEELPRPDNIFDNVKVPQDTYFVHMDAFAVNLGYHASFLKEHGVANKDSIFMVNGSLIALVSRSVKLNDWYELRGTLRYGTKDISNTYVGLLTYYKDQSGWNLKPSVASDLEESLFYDDPEIREYLEKSVSLNRVVRPGSVTLMKEFRATLKATHRVVSEAPNPSRQRTFKRESRQNCVEEPEILGKLEDCLSNSKTARSNLLKSLVSQYSETNDNAVRHLCNAILENFGRKPTPSSSTGRALLKGYLSNFKGSGRKYIGKLTIAEYLVSNFDEIVKFIFDHDEEVTADGEAWDICKLAFADRNLFFAGMIAQITGVVYSELDFANMQCRKYGLSLSSILTKNPYILQLICGLDFASIEKIAICFNRHLDKDLDTYRNITMLNDYICDQNNGSTIFTKTGLSKATLGVVLTASKYLAMKNYGTYFSMKMRGDIKAYLLRTGDDLGYPSSQFRKTTGGRYVRVIPFEALLKAIEDYRLSGLGVVLDEFVTSSKLLDQELFIYKTMRQMGMVENNYDTAEIDRLIDEYETGVGFKFEKEQRQAVHLLQHNGFLVPGCAGSGKTTVSSCILYVLEHLEPSLQISFAAPTGKASKRMQEVVKRPVKTMHSLFKIGLKKEYEFDLDQSDCIGTKAYFFDEGAMVTTSLLYKCLRSIDSESSRVFIFGDYCQLSPIGKGLPFRDLLRFMPCIFLNVSKRAADGSGIVRNCDYINNHSSDTDWVGLESTEDFQMIPCRSDQIVSKVTELCARHLTGGSSGITPDDIQVVTPLSKESYPWGARNLNTVLQPLFNPVRGYHNTFIYQLTEKVPGTRFLIGDRVMHTDKNMYGMQWYVNDKTGVFQKVYGYGICNGEVGKLLGFYRACDVTLLDEVEDIPVDFEYPEYLRDDSTWGGENKFFVAVQYYDYLGGRDIVILYRAELNVYLESNEGIVFKGDDLSRLSLFYAGTTHKLQGSEYKLIICPLDDVSYSGFITREMIYTMFTRGKQQVIGVGSVDNGRGSMLSRARRDTATQDILTVGEVIYG